MATSKLTTQQIYAERIGELGRMYKLLDELATRTHAPQQPRLLSELQSGSLNFGGVYFFYEDGEHRLQSGDGDRIVHVEQSGDLHERFYKHKLGNKVGSVFCELVGLALHAKNKKSKRPLNKRVAETLGNMWFLCLPIKDETSRIFIKRNAIALLSNYSKNKSKPQIDPPSQSWLGLSAPEEKVQISGLWNRIYVGHKEHDSNFLDKLKKLIRSP